MMEKHSALVKTQVPVFALVLAVVDFTFGVAFGRVRCFDRGLTFDTAETGVLLDDENEGAVETEPSTTEEGVAGLYISE